MGGERAVLFLSLLMSGCISDFSDAYRVTEGEAEAMVRGAPFPEQIPDVRPCPRPAWRRGPTGPA